VLYSALLPQCWLAMIVVVCLALWGSFKNFFYTISSGTLTRKCAEGLRPLRELIML